jgi:hypothetical protein
MEVTGRMAGLKKVDSNSFTGGCPHGIGVKIALFQTFKFRKIESDIQELSYVDKIIFWNDDVDVGAKVEQFTGEADDHLAKASGLGNRSEFGSQMYDSHTFCLYALRG